MNTKPDMTIPEASGYILGVALGLVRRFDKFFIILLACAALYLVRIWITYDLSSDSAAWTTGLIQGLFLGGMALWFLHRKPTR
jgi:hypothetical protein